MKLKSTKLGIATVMFFTALVNAEPFRVWDALRMIIPVGTRKVSPYDAVVTDDRATGYKPDGGDKPNQLIAWSSEVPAMKRNETLYLSESASQAHILPMQRINADAFSEKVRAQMLELEKFVKDKIIDRLPSRADLRELQMRIIFLNKDNKYKLDDLDLMDELSNRLYGLYDEYNKSWNPFKLLRRSLVKRLWMQVHAIRVYLLENVPNRDERPEEVKPEQDLQLPGVLEEHSPSTEGVLNPEAVKLDLDQQD